VVLLQPTSPIRNDGLIDTCIKRFQEAVADNLGTGFMCKYYEYGTYHQRRQDLKGFFFADGNVFVIKSTLIKSGTLFGQKAERVIVSREENVEIDDEFDFWVAEQILFKRQRQPV
jgi:N-acylneuraminate cytidylyltransferase